MARPDSDAWQPYRPPPMPEVAVDAGDEAAQWQRWTVDRDPVVRGLLATRYAGYAKAQAARLYARRSHNEVEFDDYVQFAMVGLMEAIERYQLGRGAQFKTYATSRIQGAILNGLQHMSERQEQIAWRRRVDKERAASLAPERFSTDGSQQVLHELLAVATGLALGAMLDGSGTMTGPQDSLPGDAYAQVELRQLREQLWPLLERLTEREREVIHLHYVESRDFDEIVQIMAVSKGRVSQLHRQGLARLRELIDKSRISDPTFL
jgi:RNA polymerase sigma factor FliA